MKKIIVILTLGVFVTGASFAQTTPQKERKQRTEQRGDRGDRAQQSPEERAAKRTERMAQELDLNESQQQQLQALYLKQAQEMQAMRAEAKSTEDRSTLREEMKTRRAQWESELKGILSEEQYAKYEAEQQEMRSRKKGRTHNKGAEGKERR